MLSFIRQSSKFVGEQLIRPTGCRFYRVPIVIEKGEGGERAYDIYSRLLLSRIVCVFGPVTEDMASAVVAQLLFLQFQNSKEPIHMYINSPGGIVTQGLGIYDTMQYISPPVATWCLGQACSMGAFLLAAGAPGMRKALPNSTIMVHQPSGGAGGQVTDIQIQAEHLQKMKRRLNELYVHHTKMQYDVVEQMMERDKYLTPQEAKEFGLIDQVQEISPVPTPSKS
ncbi:ATP-dependent Clp protease proteolytic subunit [Magallana gigas]|uniref:ATP-dependent Clp protease proteolytic subunit n=1 Tax=Magallana gigas TaxID=29159 RepID=UPI0005C3AF2E|eukprot:XP_011422076.1 PREDICTED: ATP-dependent Clp protease proteolytic subunit 1, mitochondrial-like [Crassostrea gigas]